MAVTVGFAPAFLHAQMLGGSIFIPKTKNGIKAITENNIRVEKLFSASQSDSVEPEKNNAVPISENDIIENEFNSSQRDKVNYSTFNNDPNFSRAIRYIAIKNNLNSSHRIGFSPNLNSSQIFADVELASDWLSNWKLGCYSLLPLNTVAKGDTISAENQTQRLANNGGNFNFSAARPLFFGWDRNAKYTYSLDFVFRTGADIPALGGYTTNPKGFVSAAIEGRWEGATIYDKIRPALLLRGSAITCNKEYKDVLGIENKKAVNFAAQAGFSVGFGRLTIVATASKVIYKNEKIFKNIYPVIGLFTDLSL